MARRPIFSTAATTGSTPGVQNNYELLGLVGQEYAFPFLAEINSLDGAVDDLNGLQTADTSASTIKTLVTAAIRKGAVWRLMDKRGSLPNDPWTVEIGPDKRIKLSDLIEITEPSGVRGQPPVTFHQSERVIWEPTPEGTPEPPMEQKQGKLAFRYLRQPQRAMRMNNSVATLGICARIFDDHPIAESAVKWVQDRIADGTLTGKPRKGEGLEYIVDCLRIHKAYTNTAKAKGKTEADAIEAAQKAVAPRGGVRSGVTATDKHNRMTALAIHLISTVSKASLQSPFTRMLPTIAELRRWEAMEPTGYEVSAWEEIGKANATAPISSLVFPGAMRVYAAPLPAADAKPDDPYPIESMTEDEIATANKVSVQGAVEPFNWFGNPLSRQTGTDDTEGAETEGAGTESTRTGGRGRGGGGFNNYGSQEAAQLAIARFLAENRLTADARAEQTPDRRWRIVPPPSRRNRRQLG